MNEQDKSDYAALKAHGLSPQKAAEVILDNKRGDTFAHMWLQIARAAAEEKKCD